MRLVAGGPVVACCTADHIPEKGVNCRRSSLQGNGLLILLTRFPLSVKETILIKEEECKQSGLS